MTWRPAPQQLLKVRLGTCVESCVRQKARPQLLTQVPVTILHKLIKIYHKTYFNGLSRLKVGTSPPCWDLGLGTPCVSACIWCMSKPPYFFLNVWRNTETNNIKFHELLKLGRSYCSASCIFRKFVMRCCLLIFSLRNQNIGRMPPKVKKPICIEKHQH